MGVPLHRADGAGTVADGASDCHGGGTRVPKGEGRSGGGVDPIGRPPGRSTRAGSGSAAYGSPEIAIVAARPRPYSPTGLFEASGPVNHSNAVRRSPCRGRPAHAVTAAGLKPPRCRQAHAPARTACGNRRTLVLPKVPLWLFSLCENTRWVRS